MSHGADGGPADALSGLARELTAALTTPEVEAVIQRRAAELGDGVRVRIVRTDEQAGPPRHAAGSLDRVAPVLEDSEDGWQMAAPFATSEGGRGLLVASGPASSRPSAAEAGVLATVLDLAAVSLERAERHGAEHAARERAEHERAQLAFLADVSNAVASSLATGELLDSLCRVAIRRLGDMATIFLSDGVVLERVAGIHREPAKQALIDKLIGAYPVPLSGTNPVARTFRTREVQVLPALDRRTAESVVDDDDYVATVLELVQGGTLVVPLVVRDRPIGVIAFGFEAQGRSFGEDEIWLATELARRAALGIDNANTYEQEHLVAELLQRAVLPEELPEVQGFDLAARYLPAGPGVEVGGDWYDAFVLDDGSLALVVGDVAGHDVAAASVMAQLRNALRAYAYTDPAPARVLGQLNRLLCRTEEPLFATAVYAVVSADRRELRWASAGHLPSVLVRSDGPRLLDDSRGVLLGLDADVRYKEARIELGPDDLLLLYTDGLIERREEALDLGIGRLSSVAGRAFQRGPSAAAACERLLGELLAGHLRSDDVCLLAAWANGAGEAVEFSVAADSSSSRVARRRTRHVMEEWGAGELSAPVELLVSELVTNAVMHVGEELRVRVRRLPAGVRVSVFDVGSDTLTTRPRRVGPESPTGRGLLIVDALADRWGVEPAQHGKQVWFELSFAGAARRWSGAAEVSARQG